MTHIFFGLWAQRPCYLRLSGYFDAEGLGVMLGSKGGRFFFSQISASLLQISMVLGMLQSFVSRFRPAGPVLTCQGNLRVPLKRGL